jgi:hypothetical protein
MTHKVGKDICVQYLDMTHKLAVFLMDGIGRFDTTILVIEIIYTISYIWCTYAKIVGNDCVHKNQSGRTLPPISPSTKQEVLMC